MASQPFHGRAQSDVARVQIEQERTLPAPTLRPWYIARRYELFALSALLLLLFAFDALRTAQSDSGRERARKARVALAGLALLVAIVWGLETRARRLARRTWQRPLHVAVVLLERDAISAKAADEFLKQANSAIDFLAQQRKRYGSQSEEPVWLHTFGPLSHRRDLPDPPLDDSMLGRAVYAWKLNSALNDVDDELSLSSGRFDVRLYVLVHPPASERGPRFVEGFAEAGGEVGIVRVDLDEKMVGTAWGAVLHELLHSVGGRDKYDARGRALVPEGLADPDQVPRYPQSQAEIMAGDIPLGDGRSRLPKDLSELTIGSATAREIGWLP